EEHRIRECRVICRHVAGELVEYARGSERLINYVPRLHRGTDTNAQAAELAFDVVDGVRTRNQQTRRTGGAEAVDLRLRMYEARRRFDEPVIGKGEIVAG